MNNFDNIQIREGSSNQLLYIPTAIDYTQMSAIHDEKLIVILIHCYALNSL